MMLNCMVVVILTFLCVAIYILRSSENKGKTKIRNMKLKPAIAAAGSLAVPA